MRAAARTTSAELSPDTRHSTRCTSTETVKQPLHTAGRPVKIPSCASLTTANLVLHIIIILPTLHTNLTESAVLRSCPAAVMCRDPLLMCSMSSLIGYRLSPPDEFPPESRAAHEPLRPNWQEIFPRHRWMPSHPSLARRSSVLRC